MKKSNLIGIAALVSAGLVFTLQAPSAVADDRVEVCHSPPGNSGNFHTITVGSKALEAHLAHGDIAGACDDMCATLCDDGDACTIDDTGDCEQVGCPATPAAVDCEDGLACTTDSCDPEDGCQTASITCEPLDLCHVAACAEPEGTCVEEEVVCGSGEACDLETGDCVADIPAIMFQYRYHPVWLPNDNPENFAVVYDTHFPLGPSGQINGGNTLLNKTYIVSVVYRRYDAWGGGGCFVQVSDTQNAESTNSQVVNVDAPTVAWGIPFNDCRQLAEALYGLDFSGTSEPTDTHGGSAVFNDN